MRLEWGNWERVGIAIAIAIAIATASEGTRGTGSSLTSTHLTFSWRTLIIPPSPLYSQGEHMRRLGQ